MYFELHGLQHAEAPTLVMSSGLGGSAHFWQTQLPALQADYRILVYDQNGTGRSPACLAADYSIKSMSEELLTLLDTLRITACHFIGHALGGLIGLQIALLRPPILQSLVLINAWSSPNPHTLRCFDVRKALLQHCRPEMYLQAQALFLYPPQWIMHNAHTLQEEEQRALQNFPDKNNLLIRIKALSEFDIDVKLTDIKTHTLLIASKDDMLVPWQRSQTLAAGLKNTSLELLDYGGHACTVTTAKQCNTLLLNHLAKFSGIKPGGKQGAVNNIQ